MGRRKRLIAVQERQIWREGRDVMAEGKKREESDRKVGNDVKREKGDGKRNEGGKL